MSGLRVGIIGMGVGERHIGGFRRHPAAEVVALCDIDPDVRARVSRCYPELAVCDNADALIDDHAIDIVSIASYDDAHYPQVMRALERGKHVFVEKPLCMRVKEFKDICRALADRPNLRLCSNAILRLAARFQQLRVLISAGAFGRLFNVEGDYLYGRLTKLTEGWRGRIPGYSVTLGGAIHLIDLILWLTCDKALEVVALGNGIASRGSPFRGNDMVSALITFQSGMIGKISANFASVHPHFHRLLVYGTEATFENRPEAGLLWSSRDPAVAPGRIDGTYPGVDKGDLIPSFVDAVLGKGEAVVTETDVLAAMAIGLAIDRSLAREGQSELQRSHRSEASRPEPAIREIPFGRPIIGEAERAAVLDVLNGPILVHGPRTAAFENAFARWTGAPHAVSVSSCTAAMHLVYFALDYGPGDEVIVPAQTHTATAHAVELTGAKPVFVDAERRTGNIDLSAIEAAITARTRAIAVVHYLGVPIDMAGVNAVAKRHGLFVLEDCALAIGTRIEGIHAGLLGDVGCFSFYPVKHMTTAEGGMIVTRNAELAAKLRHMRAFGVDRHMGERKIPGMYDVTALGFNYRMNEIEAAIGIEQVKRLDDILARRAINFAALDRRLRGHPDLELFAPPSTGFENSHYSLSIVLKPRLAPLRFEIVSRLNSRGVGTSIYYPKPVPHMNYYATKYGYGTDTSPNAAWISSNSIALPVGPHLDEADMEYTADTLIETVDEVGTT